MRVPRVLGGFSEVVSAFEGALRMKNNRIGRRGPVVLAEKPSAQRRRLSGREGVLDAEALVAPVPGPLLVLLSRLHRSEPTPGDRDEAER